MRGSATRYQYQPIVIDQGKQSWRRQAGMVAVGGGLGVTSTYLLDPQRGRARRARIQDMGARRVHRFRKGAETFLTDAGNRARGVPSALKYRMTGEIADNRVLHERVRARLGRFLPNPSSVDVQVDHGIVTLTGDVLVRDDERAQRAVSRVPGVRGVDVQWTAHEDSTGISALQGEGGQPEPVPELLQQNWSPTARVLVTAGSALLWLVSRRLPQMLSWPLRITGVAFAVRAVTNLSTKRLTGLTAGRSSIDVQDAITISAPTERLWSLVSDYVTFPHIMSEVREVRRDGNGRSHWVVSGPARLPVRFDAEETKREEGREIAWKTSEGQLIAHSGQIRVDPDGNGSTRLSIQLTYNPVAGAMGHSVARLFRADPKHKLHGELQRLKSFAETGKHPRDAAQPVR